MSTAAEEARRRRTFAIISHPDAGKTTLTEKCLLYAGAIGSAGMVRGRAGRKTATSDFHAMEQERGISIASTVLQFGYRGHTFNLLDTPGHADFSEDTYRVLAAADFAVMVLDAAKGLEPQTLKLFDVCRHRGLPVLGFVNKYDRPGREPLELVDEMEQTIGLRATPVTWPVGIAGELRGLVDRRTGAYTRYARTVGGGEMAPETVVDPDTAAVEDGADWERAQEEMELLEAMGAVHDDGSFLAGKSAPMFFGSAMTNAGVRPLLDAVVDLAPPPRPREQESGEARDLEAAFSGVVFKVAAGGNKAHRDRTAYVRVCSGRFERGMQVVDAATGRVLTTKYAHTAFASERNTVEDAWPGDVVGLVNAGALRAGDTLYSDDRAVFPAMPSFAPEHFRVASARDSGRYKQFRRGIDQLDDEGVVQVLRSDRRGEHAPVLGAVGPMQFEVVTRRLADEFGVEVDLHALSYTVARRTDAASAAGLAAVPGVEVLQRGDGSWVALLESRWRAQFVRDKHPDLLLEEFVGSREPDRL